jgi:regulator of sigma D
MGFNLPPHDQAPANCTVGILINLRCNEDVLQGDINGTGFFIGSNDVITCYHVIESACQQANSQIGICYQGVTYKAKILFVSPQPERLDFAILQIDDRAFTQPSHLVPIGKGRHLSMPTEFLACGFGQGHPKGAPLLATGKILGTIDQHPEFQYWQLSQESSNNQQMRGGMSGAPIYSTETREIIGMFVEYDEAKYGITPYALNFAIIGEVWPPVQRRLNENELYHQINDKNIWKIGGNITRSQLFDLFNTFLGTPPPTNALDHELVDCFLEEIHRKECSSDLLEYLKTRHPTIALGEIKRGRAIQFVNRTEERQLAIGDQSPTFIFFESPYGYGKTTLLFEIRNEYFKRGWLCIRINCTESRIRSHGSFIRHISKALNIEVTDNETIDEFCESIIDHIDKLKVSGVLILLDNADQISDKVIAPIYEIIHELYTLFNNNRNRVGVKLMAFGKAKGSTWEEQARSSGHNLEVLVLSPFEFRYVSMAVRDALPKQSDHETYAAYVLYLSSGHPYLIDQIIQKLKTCYYSIPQFFKEHSAEVESITQEITQQAKASINQDAHELREVFSKIAVYPVLGHKLLEYMIQGGVFGNAFTYDEFDLVGKLLKTRYYVWQDGFIHDDIVRCLLSNDLRRSNQPAYVEACLYAKEIYQKYIRNRVEGLSYVLLAALEVELHLIDVKLPGDTPDECSARLDYFFNNCLPIYWEMIAEKTTDQRVILANLKQFLDPESASKNKIVSAFRFLINFVLRQTQYSDRPYQMLREAIDRMNMPPQEK